MAARRKRTSSAESAAESAGGATVAPAANDATEGTESSGESKPKRATKSAAEKRGYYIVTVKESSRWPMVQAASLAFARGEEHSIPLNFERLSELVEHADLDVK
jgi:hypothetical protein